jgi:acyl-CoA synthetase (AMP-forming)/AMP-acid ligase II
VSYNYQGNKCKTSPIIDLPVRIPVTAGFAVIRSKTALKEQMKGRGGAMTIRKFRSFIELTEDFATRDKIALIFSDEDGNMGSISYAELADRIKKRAAEISEKGSGTDCVYATPDVDAIVEIFAEVYARRCIIMADPMMPEQVLKEAVAGANRYICEVTEKKGDGEMLFFTSGTTSRSKLVRLTSKSLCCSAWSGQCMLPCNEDDIILCVLPLSHVFGFVCGLMWGLAYGATVALCGDIRDIFTAPMTYRPTILPTVPSIVEAMVRYEVLNPELKTVLIGAAPCNMETAINLKAEGIATYFGYGMTETSSGIAITQDLAEPEALYPCPGADIQIEPDGEISVATPCMMKGYLNNPDTYEGYRFFTGDLGAFDEKGRLHLQGRKKDVLIMADGTKIYCPEYEHDLAEMSGVEDIALIEQKGRAVLIAGAGSDLESLRKAVDEYNKTMMRSQQVYRIEEFGRPLPRTMTGKLRRYELGRKYQQ